MTMAIFLVMAAATCLAVILRLAVARSLQVAGDASVAGRIEPVDIEAFRNLVDPAEDEYLRRRLPAGEFRKVQRERLRAMSAYVRTAGRNATVLIQIGQAALESSDTRAAEAARQLVEQALLLRRNAGFTLIRIHLAVVWPSAGGLSPGVLGRYEQLSGSALLLSRLQNPAAPVRIVAT